MAVNSAYYEVEVTVVKDVFYYSFPWPIENDLDVVLYYGEEGQDRTLMDRSYYEIQNGNTVYIDQIFLNEELVGLTLYIQRHTPRTQNLVLHPKSAINPATLERALDHLEYQIQELESNSVSEDIIIDFNNKLYLLEQLIIATQQSLSTEISTRTSQVDTINAQLNSLSARIDSMAEMGRYLGTFNTYAAIPKTTSGWPGEEGINDFVNVRQDENHGGQTSRYIISAIINGNITWTYDIALGTDVSGKADKVASPVADNIVTLDSSGNIKDGGVPISAVGIDNTKLPLSGGQMSGPINMAGHEIFNVPNPTTDGSAVNRKFLVDYIASTGGGTGGTFDHDNLINRDIDDQHPDTAITHGASTVFDVLESQATAIASKANAADLANYATIIALNDGLATKANTSHAHSISQVTNLQTVLDAKLEDSLSDGKIYGRKDGNWVETSGGGGSDDPTVPVGAILPFAGPYAPTGYLFCDGALYAKDDWPELYAAIGDAWRQATDTDATKFRVPDLRDEFLRGTGATRTLGTKQSDAIRNITGSVISQPTAGLLYNGSSGQGYVTGAFKKSDSPGAFYLGAASGATSYNFELDASLVVPTADENRPRNVAANFIIKAMTGGRASEEDFTSAVSAVNGQYSALAARVDGKLAAVDYSAAEQDTGIRWLDGKKIYWKTVNTGALVNSANKTVAHGVASFSALVQAYGWASNGSHSIVLPWTISPTGIFVDATSIQIACGAGMSAYGSSSVTIFYTCSNR